MLTKDQISKAFNGKLNINPSDLDTIECQKCSNKTFNQTFIVKRVPSVLSPSGKQIMIPVPVFYCSMCGEICKQLLPEEVEKG